MLSATHNFVCRALTYNTYQFKHLGFARGYLENIGFQHHDILFIPKTKRFGCTYGETKVVAVYYFEVVI